MPDQPSAEDPGVPRWAFVGGVFALVAIALEIWGNWGTGADPRPPMSWLVPSGWPMAIRVAWWLLAAAGTVVANRGLAVATGRSRRVATAVTALPFIAFAVGIAVGAEWTTWH